MVSSPRRMWTIVAQRSWNNTWLIFHLVVYLVLHMSSPLQRALLSSAAALVLRGRRMCNTPFAKH